MKSNGRPLIPYMRQSRAKERTISIDEQRRDIRRWADAAGVELAAEVVEQNVSGSNPWRERGLGEAVDACSRGEASGIIVAWQDRLSRENGRATAEALLLGRIKPRHSRHEWRLGCLRARFRNSSPPVAGTLTANYPALNASRGPPRPHRALDLDSRGRSAPERSSVDLAGPRALEC
jgi:hypothetical protein